jgi:hypothetical protein
MQYRQKPLKINLSGFGCPRRDLFPTAPFAKIRGNYDTRRLTIQASN